MLAVGAGVLGYLPGYLHEEGYADGQRFALLTLVLPTGPAAVVAVAILAAVAVAVAWRRDPDRPWLGAATMVGTALLVTSPSYPWYALLLVVLVGARRAGRWLAVAAAGYLAQYAHELGLTDAHGQRWGYGVALGAVLAAGALAWWRRPDASGTAVSWPQTWIRRRPVDGA